MKCVINDKEYEVVIIKKNNKNTYIRVKDDMKIYITTNHLATTNYLQNLLNNNKNEILSMVTKVEKKLNKKQLFSYLGKVYDIIIVPTLDITFIDGNNIYVKNMQSLNKWLKKKQNELFEQRLNLIYNLFKENIVFPELKIRKMTTRWGVCNKKNKTITLNSELIRYDLVCLDYVIVHELCHFVHFDHSKKFWELVFKYCPEYKNIRKILKEE